MKVLLTIILVMCHTIILAQSTLSGTVKDAKSSSLTGATIQLNGPVKQVVIADFEGKFTFRNLKEGDYRLEVSYVGFNKFVENITVPLAGELNIVLQEDLYLA